MTRYLSGLCVAGLGLCGGGWLIVAAFAFGGEAAGPAGRVNLLTGAGLAVVSCVSLGCWATAWRRRMRVDGVLADRFVSRRQARRNRRELSRDVGRTARLAKRSAREARRAARRSARQAGGGVLSSGAALGSASGGDGPYSVAVSPAEAADHPGESAAELLAELRAMLLPLLTAAGERPAGGLPAPSDVPVAGPRPLPRRTPRPGFVPPSASPAAEAPASPAPVAPVPRIPRPASPATGDDLRFAADSEEAWW